ncbi:MAG: DUF692 domain-containing protein [Xanthomonadales bacterium]|nr:DUF692 domain-containing protein [Xanthomonadales bacterium]
MGESSPLSALGVGLGLRRGLMTSLLARDDLAERVDFFEVAPENWIGLGGRWGRQFRQMTERFPLICHGLSLSLGGPSPLDETLVRRVGQLMASHDALLYSEHLSACTDDAHLYDLMPIPFTEDAVVHVSDRISRVQDLLGQRIAVENSSYYAPLASDMAEIDFVKAILERADCQLLLDVNNVYVNSVNHRYDARSYIDAVPAERVAYLHVAGHENEADDLIVDTHGAPIIDPVFDLLAYTYERIGARPTLLERDFNLPPLAELLTEVDRLREVQRPWLHTPATTLRASA